MHKRSFQVPKNHNFAPKIFGIRLNGHCFFGTLPSSICSLSNLEELVISNNAFYGKLPNQMASLTKLKVLLISNNDFKGELVQLKTQLPNLKQFDFIDGKNQSTIATLDDEDNDD